MRVAERIEFDAVQIRGAGGEIADIQRGDIALRIEIQPEDGEVFSGGSGRRAVKRGRAVVAQKGAVDADVDIRRLEHFGEKQAACRIRTGERKIARAPSARGIPYRRACRRRAKRAVCGGAVGRQRNMDGGKRFAVRADTQMIQRIATLRNVNIRRDI